MRRISLPWTALYFRVLPTLVVVAVVECAPLAGELMRRGQWFVVVLAILLLCAFVGIWRAYVPLYDAWMRDDRLVLRRGVTRVEFPIARLTKVEIPLRHLKTFPEVWLHWTDDAGARQTARFISARSPDWVAFCDRLPAHVLPTKAR